MVIKPAKRLAQFKEYVFSKLGKEVAKVEQESGRKVLNFGPGNPDYPPSEGYINKLMEFIKDPQAHLYPGFGANENFSKGLINWYKARFGVELVKDELLPLLGGKDGVAHLAFALLDESDEVLIPDPGYPAFTDPALMVGAKAVYYDLKEENDFQIDLTDLEANLTEKTKFIWVNFPSNPTGQVISLEELKKIVDFAKEKNVLIVYDNAYSEITFDGYVAPSILQIEGAKEVAVELGSFSKTFSFAGFRMGWLVGNREVIAALAKVKSQTDSGMPTFLQNLGAFALTNFDRNWHQEMIADYQRRRDIIASHLTKLGLQFSKPKGALYLWAKIPENAKNSEEFCAELLKEKQILLAPGTAYGQNGEGFIRACFSVNINGIDSYFP